MPDTKQINVRLPLELHKALDDHRVRTGEPKSDAIRRGIEIALSLAERDGGEIVAQTKALEEQSAQLERIRDERREADAAVLAAIEKFPRPDPPTTAEDSVDLVVWLSGRTGMPRALCVRAVNRGRVTVAGHVWNDNCVSKADLGSVRLDGEPV